MNSAPGGPVPQPSVGWFYEEHGTRHGPVSEQQMVRLIQALRLSYSTSVWTHELPDWVRLADTRLQRYL